MAGTTSRSTRNVYSTLRAKTRGALTTRSFASGRTSSRSYPTSWSRSPSRAERLTDGDAWGVGPSARSTTKVRATNTRPRLRGGTRGRSTAVIFAERRTSSCGQRAMTCIFVGALVRGSDYPAWSSPRGEVIVTVTAFCDELVRFDRALIDSMARRVEQIADRWARLKIDIEKLRRDHADRATWMQRAMTMKRSWTASWSDVLRRVEAVEARIGSVRLPR